MNPASTEAAGVPVNSEMEAHWNGPGGKNWLDLQTSLDPFLQPFSRQLVQQLGFSKGDLVLDVGCGCGGTSIEIAELIGPMGHVHGLDISQPLLQEARARKRAAHLHNLTFGCGDAQTDTFSAGAFNTVFSRFGVMFFDDPLAAFRNLAGAIDTGGRLGFSCWQPALDNEWVTLPMSVLGKYLPPTSLSVPDEPGPFSFGDPKFIENVLANSGFFDISIDRLKSKVLVGDTLGQAATFLSKIGPVGAAISKLAPDLQTQATMTAVLRENLKHRVTDSGVYLQAAAWIVTAQVNHQTRSVE